VNVSRLSLSARVSLAASAAVLAVVAVHTVLVQSSTAAEVRAWEREEVAGVAHHVARMVDGMPPQAAARAVARASEGLAPFGIELAFSPTDGRPAGRAVSVPVAGGTGFVVARASDDLSATLRRRLVRSSVLLAAGLLAALLAAIQASVRWGLVRPLRSLERQLRLMAHGPWSVPGKVTGAPEIERLAHRIQGLGASLERSVTAWVGAERRAAAECARIELRRRVSPTVREINLAASALLATRALQPGATRALRRLLAALDTLRTALDEPLAAAPTSPDTARTTEVPS